MATPNRVEDLRSASIPQLTLEQTKELQTAFESGVLDDFVNKLKLTGAETTIGLADAYETSINSIVKSLGSKNRLSTRKGELEKASREFKREEDKRKQLQFLAEPSRTDLGVGAAELLSFGLPALRAGNLRSVNKLIGSGGKLGTVKGAKALSKDALINARNFAAIDVGLSKVFGRSNEEALNNALAAGTIGLFGAPIVAGARQGIRNLQNPLSNLGLQQGPQPRPQPIPIRAINELAPEMRVTDPLGNVHEFPDTSIKQLDPVLEEVQTVGGKDAGTLRQEAFAEKQINDLKQLQEGNDKVLRDKITKEFMDEAGLEFKSTEELVQRGELGIGSSMLREDAKVSTGQIGGVPRNIKVAVERIMRDEIAKADYRDQIINNQKVKLGIGDNLKEEPVEIPKIGDVAPLTKPKEKIVPPPLADPIRLKKPITPDFPKKPITKGKQHEPEDPAVAKATREKEARDRKKKPIVVKEDTEPDFIGERGEPDPITFSSKKDAHSQGVKDSQTLTKRQALDRFDRIEKKLGSEKANEYFDAYTEFERRRRIQTVKSTREDIPEGVEAPKVKSKAKPKEVPKIKEEVPERPSKEIQEKIDKANKEFDEKFQKAEKENLAIHENKTKEQMREATEEYQKLLTKNGSITERIEKTKPKADEVEPTERKNQVFTAKEANEKGLIPDGLTSLMNDIVRTHGDVKINMIYDGSLVHPQTLKPSNGYYDFITGEIFIDGTKFASDFRLIHAVVHEMVHAKSWDSIRNDETLKTELETLFEQAKSATKDRGHWSKNIDEFLAEGLSNKDFILFLQKQKIKNEPITLWDRFKEIIYKALKIDPHTNIHAELDRLLGNIGSPNYKTAKGAKAKEALNKVNEEYISSKNKFFNSETWTNLISDVNDVGASKAFRDLHNIRRRSMDEAASTSRNLRDSLYEITDETVGSPKFIQSARDAIKRTIDPIGKKRRASIYTHLLETDYASIKRFGNKQAAEDFMRVNQKIRSKAGKFIEQTAKGMRDSGQMNHRHYTNNGFQIAKRVGLSPNKHGDIIDDMISITAMKDKDWDFVVKNSSKDWFTAHMQIASDLNIQSRELFKNNPEQRIKGYQAEIYESPYDFFDVYKGPVKEFRDLTREEIGIQRSNLLEPKHFKLEKKFDTSKSYIEGAIPINIESSKKGTIINKPKDFVGGNKEMEAYASLNNLGLIIDKMGNPRRFRKVASESHKSELGKVRDASDILAQTYQNNIRKIIQRDSAIPEILKILEDKNNKLIRGIDETGTKPFKNKEEAIEEGFIPLSKKKIKALPSELNSGRITHISKKYERLLLGDEETQILSSHVGKVTEKIFKDLIREFKENVVIKNSTSLVNNVTLGFVAGLQHGISPLKIRKLMMEGYREQKFNNAIFKKMADLDIKGKRDSDSFKKLQDKLDESFLFQMREQGMAMSAVSQLTSSPQFSRRFSEKVLKDQAKRIVGDKNIDWISDLAANIHLSPHSFIGSRAMNIFSSIDTISRYALAKHLKDQGKSTREAVATSNSFYGDLDKTLPMWVQNIQDYGAIPFAGWLFRVSGGVTKAAIDNPVKTAVISIILAEVSDITGYRTASWDPVDPVLGAGTMFSMSPWLNLEGTAKRIVNPALHSKTEDIISGKKSPESLFITRNF